MTPDVAPAPGRPRSRLRACVIGALVPLAIGEAAILAFMTAAASGAPFRAIGPVATFAMILPGTLLIGCAVAFPTAMAMVFSMTWLMRRSRCCGHPASWTAAGVLFAAPLACLLWSFDPSGVGWLPLSGLTLGAIGGLSAWLARPRQDTSR